MSINRTAFKRAACMAAVAAAALALAACDKKEDAPQKLDPIPAATNALPAAQANPTLARAAGPAAEQGLQEGRDYKIVAQPGYQPAAGGKVTVKEYFWYGCPHCYRALPKMEEWMKSGDSQVEFQYSPYPATPMWETTSRLHYAMQLQHLSEDERRALFDAIHKDGVSPANKDALIAWAGAHGWNADQLRTDWDSFGVSSQIARDKKEGDGLGLEGVPAIVINGKYQVGIENAQAQNLSEADLAVAAQRVAKAIEDGKLKK